MITQVVARVHQEDPVQGKWCVDGPELEVWVDASSLASRVSFEQDGAGIENAIQEERDTQHINLADFDAVQKGVNMVLMWKETILHLHTDSLCVHKWITDTLTGKASVHTRAASEMLIRQQLDLIKKAVEPLYCASAVSPSKHDFDRIRSIHQ